MPELELEPLMYTVCIPSALERANLVLFEEEEKEIDYDRNGRYEASKRLESTTGMDSLAPN